MAEAHVPAAAAAAPSYVNGMLDDSWADNVGGGVLPQVLADAPPFPALALASPGASRRVLVQRVSRERTPPPRRSLHLGIGDFVKIKGLEKRAELNGVCGSVIEPVADDCRVAVKLVTSECIRVKESNLTVQRSCVISCSPLAWPGATPSSSVHVN